MNLKTISTLALTATAVVFTSCVNNPASPLNKPANTAADQSGAPGSGNYPTAKPLLNAEGQPVKNVYISPFKPYNPIDTKGYSSGDVVGDPSTAKINPKTGKGIASTAKIFRLP